MNKAEIEYCFLCAAPASAAAHSRRCSYCGAGPFCNACYAAHVHGELPSQAQIAALEAQIAALLPEVQQSRMLLEMPLNSTIGPVQGDGHRHWVRCNRGPTLVEDVRVAHTLEDVLGLEEGNDE